MTDSMVKIRFDVELLEGPCSGLSYEQSLTIDSALLNEWLALEDKPFFSYESEMMKVRRNISIVKGS